MKRVLLIVVAAAIALTANATNYYFSTRSGDDSRLVEQARNSATPWKTLKKLNDIFQHLQPGDSVLFNRGEVFPGTFAITASGTPGAPIVIGAYGTGARPEITGFASITNWTASGNNIWEAECNNCTAALNTVIIDNSMRPMGRYPNANTSNGGHLTIDGSYGKSNFYDNELTSTVNWTGAEVVIRKNAWIIDRQKVTGHSGGNVSYENTTGYTPITRYGYFFQNDIRTLDQDGEWYFNPSNRKLYIYSATNPAGRSVKASTQETVIDCNARNYVTIDNIQITGGDLHSIRLDYAHYFTLQNTDVLFSGTFAVKAFITDHLTVKNTNINHAFNNGIYAAPYCSNSDLSNNRVHNIGLVPGMGRSHNQTYEGISVHGTANMIQRNKVDSIGYIAIRFLGDYSTVQENYITDFLLTKDDGGGIYTNGDNEYFGEKILNNVVMNGRGAPAGTYTTVPNAANGIYVDDKGAHIEIVGNTVAHCSENGIFLHNAHEIILKNNTTFDNKNQVAMIHDVLEPLDPIRNIETDGNIFFSKTSSQLTSHLETMKDDLRQFGRFDNNFYCRPINESMVMKTTVMGNEQSLNFENWQQTYQQDQNGGKTPGNFDPYTYKIIGTNLFSNGAFNQNIDNASSFSIPFNSSTTWSNEGQLDGGSLKLNYNTGNGTITSADIILNIGTVTAGKSYVLNFDMLGKNNTADLDVFIRNNSGNYNNLSEIRAFKNSYVRTARTFVFHATETCSSATLVFRINGKDCPLYLDNIDLFEAQVTANNVDEFVRFEFNATAAPKTVALNGEYMDVEKNQYSQSITLAPFSSAILILNEQASLPLRFVEFKGKKNNQNIDLKWITANEVNTSHFEIQKSGNGIEFAKIGRVNSSNIATGTSNYSFTDYTPLANNNYYRLKQIDKDGKSSYSNIVMIGNGAELKMSVSPNPATDKIRVLVNTPQTNQKAVLTLHSLSGVTVKSMPVTLSNEATTVDLTGLASGIYVVHVAGEGINFNERIVKK